MQSLCRHISKRFRIVSFIDCHFISAADDLIYIEETAILLDSYNILVFLHFSNNLGFIKNLT